MGLPYKKLVHGFRTVTMYNTRLIANIRPRNLIWSRYIRPKKRRKQKTINKVFMLSLLDVLHLWKQNNVIWYATAIYIL